MNVIPILAQSTIPWGPAVIAIVVSTMVGVLFGTVPATRAAQLDPVESLRYE